VKKKIAKTKPPKQFFMLKQKQKVCAQIKILTSGAPASLI
jgi:hypothetical protein